MLELSGPTIISLEITARCQGSCPGCSNVFTRDLKELGLSSWEQILDKLNPYVQEYRVTGGEPTLYPRFFDLLGLIEKSQKYFHIFTNGRWEKREQLLERFRDFAYLGSFLVSLHGADAGSHEAFSGDSSFEDVKTTIRTATASGFEVHTNTVLTRRNFNQIRPIADLSMELGARYAVFGRYIGSPITDMLPADELQEALNQIDALRREGYNVVIGNCIPYCFFPSSSVGCAAALTYATIDPAGNMRPCSHSPQIAGNLLSRSLKEVWHSRVMRRWRKDLPRACRHCSRISSCPGGCKAMADILGLPADPLIGDTVKESEEPQALEVNLDSDLCPVPRFISRPENFGLALIRHTQVIPVSHKAARLIQALDGKTTLGEIERRFGAVALSFIYSLYVRSFIEFRSRPGETDLR